MFSLPSTSCLLKLPIVTIVATLCSFKITELFSFMKAKKSPSDFIKFLLFWSTLKTFDIKQGSPMTEEKETTIVK